jgi:hypothetical protein
MFRLMNNWKVPDKRLVARKPALAFLLFLIIFSSGCEKGPDPVIFPSSEVFVAYFSPQDSLYPHLIYLIDEAKESIYAAFYKIELEGLSRALMQAHQLRYLSGQTNRPVIDLVTEAISKYCS